jgi:uncharacterized iron-regulated membrane protein
MRIVPLRQFLRVFHRYLGLVLALVWLTQALSGIVIVFGRDLGHEFAAVEPSPFDAAAFGTGMQKLQAAHTRRQITFVLAADPDNRWFDVLYRDGDEPSWYARVDGRGTVLYQRPFFADFPSPGLFMTALHLHQTFLNDDVGLTLVGISGLFLLVSIFVGVTLAWPRTQQWGLVLKPRATRARLPWLYGWHRALGLWFAVPAIATIIAGVLLAIGEPLKERLQGTIDEPKLSPKLATASAPSFADALQIALAQFPRAKLSIVATPDEENPWYRIRVMQAGEIRRIFGTSVVWVDARDGAVLQVHDALKARPAIAFFNGLYPFHSGEIAGFGGRLLTLAMGLWLSAMIVLGVLLWWRRRAA